MNRIKILGNDISDLIAAGEVVERPASVVKELVENSIDAGATKITVEIIGGGLEYIRVTDDGCGMSPEDAKTAFQKHATSKISSRADLYSINTLGFRGEALAAISAVSKVYLKTKEPDSVSGYCITIEGGSITDEAEIGASDGTTIEIRDLFYNTPARLKFMKSEQSERSAISGLIEKLALSHTNIAFSYIINGVQRFFTAPNGNLKNVIYSVFGSELAKDMIPLEYSDSAISVSGYIGRPLATRPNRNLQMFFVNGRLVKSKTLQQAFEMSFRNSMLVGRYPVCVILLTINSSEIDVNVHPSKLEIKFSNDKSVAAAVSAAVREALASESGIYQIKMPENSLDGQKDIPALNYNESTSVKEVENVRTVNNWEITTYKRPPARPSLQGASYNERTRRYDSANSLQANNEKLQMRSDPLEALSRIKEYVEKNNIDIDPEQILKAADFSSVSNDQNLTNTHSQKSDAEEEIKLTLDDMPQYKLIGEVFNTYVIIEFSEEIMFIDKHALHERMIFEKLRSSEFIEVQTLLTPRIISVSNSDRIVLIENKEILKKIGFDIDDLNGTLILREIPSIIETEDTEVLLSEIAEELKLKMFEGKELLEKFLYTISCKAAIKSGKRSSGFELKGLIDEYLKKRDSLKYCPHGRPIVFVMTKTAIEKQFRRIVG